MRTISRQAMMQAGEARRPAAMGVKVVEQIAQAVVKRARRSQVAMTAVVKKLGVEVKRSQVVEKRVVSQGQQPVLVLQQRALEAVEPSVALALLPRGVK